MAGRVNVLVLPLLRRTWLFHAWSEPTLATAGQQAKDLVRSGGASTSSSMTWEGVKQRFDTTVKTQWREMQQAPEGSFRSYLYKLALFVLSREDPIETFLKSVPKDSADLHIMYPSSLSETLVRRRLRLLALKRVNMHRSKMVAWGLASLPQLPLILTPIPNITVYYSVYRYLSHLQAMQGAMLFKSAFEWSDAKQLQQLYRKLQSVHCDTPTSKYGLLTWRSNKRTAKAISRDEQRCSLLLEKKDATGKVPIVHFESSPLLEEITSPSQRWSSLLGEEAVQKLASRFKLHDLAEHYARAKRATSQDKGGGAGTGLYKLTADAWRASRAASRARREKAQEARSKGHAASSST